MLSNDVRDEDDYTLFKAIDPTVGKSEMMFVQFFFFVCDFHFKVGGGTLKGLIFQSANIWNASYDRLMNVGQGIDLNAKSGRPGERGT